ncbi:hypothetical protein GWK47_000278 [Chionoecetes opilio]|uniref:Uncharacterized protein n=1 Tax=Chionoecetes opilio TaxID=41210 RepID=A0A8J8WCN1_CHIOP|nr:hypothetical protein GWK47_000278 [Chionoecetes opilio]
MILELSLRVVYRGVLPVVVALGVVASLATIWVLAQPGLRKAAANRYFWRWRPLICCFSCSTSPSWSVTAAETFPPTMAPPNYFTHFGWSLAFFLPRHGHLHHRAARLGPLRGRVVLHRV